MMAPRPMLIRIAVFFILRIRARWNMPCVAGVCGAQTTT
jgi:hypothetical protein